MTTTPPTTPAPTSADSRSGRGIVPLLALGCGVAVGNIYFPQAITPLIGAALGVRGDAAVLVSTAAQFGYAVGIFLLVPLGDRLSHRPLLGTLLGATGVFLLAAGCAPGYPPLLGLSLLAGVSTVLAPLAAPLAAKLVPAGERGRVTGVLLSGSIGGMLLSRTAGGWLGEWLGWRAPYLVAAGLTLLLAVLLVLRLPATQPSSALRYPALLAEPARLLRREPQLRLSCWYQACVFAAFTATWNGLALVLTGPRYGLSSAAVGLFALVGAATMVVTPIAGRYSDRYGPDAVNTVSMLGVLLAALVLALGAAGGGAGLGALVVGTLVLDVAMQAGMVANQVRIFRLRADAASRLNTAYMTCAFLGGAAGSAAAARVYAGFGWWGVCGLVGLLGALALARHATHRVSNVAEHPGY